MNTDKASFLQELLAGVPLPLFFAEYWQKKPLLIKGNCERFSSLFDKTAFEQALRQCDGLKISARDGQGVSVERNCHPLQAQAAFRAGATVCISGIQSNARLDQFTQAFAQEVLQAGQLSFNCYYSPNGHGFSLHLDDHPVWILQIEGKKKWWYSKEPYDNPLSTVSFAPGATVAHVPWAAPIPRPDESHFHQAVLEPGDVLYLPEGTWHRAAAEGESLALTLACGRTCALDLVQQAVATRIAHRRSLRENLPGAWAQTLAQTSTTPQALEVKFAAVIDELRDMVNQLTPQDLYAVWQQLALKDDPNQ